MSNVLDQWLGDSIAAIERLEREIGEHHHVIQQAMATIRRHTGAVERIEQHIDVIRQATQRIEGNMEEERFDDSFDRAFGEGYEEIRELEDSSAEVAVAAPDDVDDRAGTPVLQLLAAEIVAPGKARLPPPPPAAAAHSRARH